MGRKVTDYLLYRWRYILGYSFIGLAIAGLLVIAGLFIPGGLTQAEMNSVVTSANLNLSWQDFNPESIINLPYYLLQMASLSIFGVSTLSIKLPSLILGALAALGLLLLLKMWFRPNIAILTTLLVMTTGQFLYFAQSGTSHIVYVFWPVWLLLLALMISRRFKFSIIWKIMLFAAAALSLYTPLSIYILLALISAALLHPHLRFIIRRLSPGKISLAAAGGLILLAPLIYAIVRQPEVGLVLLGIPSEWPNILNNVTLLITQYFNFLSPTTDALMTPVYGLGSMALILLGVVRLFMTSYTARSYIITMWIIFLLPIIVINPDFNSITFVPIALLMAMGIDRLLSSWYSLFPRNPYARVVGLIPLIILIGGLMTSGINRYIYGYLYNPNTAGHFSHDLQILNRELAKHDTPTTLVISKDKADFYEVVARYHPNLSVSTKIDSTDDSKIVIVGHQAHTPRDGRTPHQVVTDDSSDSSDRFYIYKTEQN